MGKEPRRPTESTDAAAPTGPPRAADESDARRARQTVATEPDRVARDRDEIERLVEADPALVPQERSALLVEPAVLDPAEVAALLSNLASSLDAAACWLSNDDDPDAARDGYAGAPGDAN